MQGNMNEPAIDCWQRNLAVCLFGAFTTVLAMTLILPFLPVYIGQLGVSGHAAIVQWSGIAYAATFVTAGLVAPLWGMLGDRYGRKPMLVRASLGMAITMLLMGLASDIWQFIGLRLLAGIAGGYSSGATILVAVQAPKSRSAWALGLLSSGVMAGNLLGPLVGGFLPPLIGIRATFWGASGLIFIAFVFTTFMLRETARPSVPAVEEPPKVGWSNMPNKAVILAMLATGLLLMIANMSVEPIITVYIETLLEDSRRVTSVAGLAMSAAALGSIISATYLGKVADRIGYGVIMIAALSVAAVLLIPQAFVYAGWQLIALRFLMGMALGGLLPCMAAVIRHSVPERFVGSAMGWSLSAQFAGQVIGPVIGGFVGGQFGMRSVFLVTSLLMLAGALFNWRALGHSTR
ncbi:MFS transporter [Pseudomonas aeruginosa]|uniref:MFS transporter n=1 Tax=Pseudomonas aeruginosa TaxID=287 RepID=UPI0005BC10A6|nr:MFS transporter [Pseudomonas aeruginosa]EKW2905598.1 MFS transporter [Pseudomonas aeruginosa]EMD9533296.1 MFS transporter [Pseudomonas aeruginosa]MBG6948300.1 MFS transporter [Pseudomonas aeruginosa]MBI7198788.1 MFS transporter [Pseudomonas aeruginosa]MBI7277877.1 MFS transporter [Pseudomonas aeruginosa]